jgi:hypothetical protein
MGRASDTCTSQPPLAAPRLYLFFQRYNIITYNKYMQEKTDGFIIKIRLFNTSLII